MATFKYYLDKRKISADGLFPLRLCINHKGGTAFVSLGIRLGIEQWDGIRQRIVNKPDRLQLNGILMQKLADFQRNLMALSMKRRISSMSAVALRDELVFMSSGFDGDGSGTFKRTFEDFISTHENKRTQDIYRATWLKIERYDKHAARLSFEDVNREWLQMFFAWLADKSPSVNARNIHMRNIRAVFNFAIDNELTASYPFRRVKITPVATVKRNLSVQQLRYILNANIGNRQHYLDLFLLSFFLIGINIVDLLTVRRDALRNGRLEFNRRKTNTLYSIKVEPEAMEIIGRYKGTEHLLRFCDGGYNYRLVAMQINKTLQTLMPKLSTYWARHSWASIASELDIPEDVISRALGHSTSGASVTRTYINFNRKKVDAANRAVIDYVLYDKKTGS